MAGAYATELAWIATQHERLCERVARWAAINSGSRNVAGLARMADEIEPPLVALGATVERVGLENEQVVGADGELIDVPLGPAVSAVMRPDASLKVFLGIHMDTVFAADHPFQEVNHPNPATMRGPGVADAKGGIAVMLSALEALERSPVADRLGWEVLINPDEEIASPGSAPLLQAAARRNTFGLVYEPALPDGSLAAARKGSGNFTLVVRGVAAHAGREFERGRSAVTALAELVVALDRFGRQLDGVTINVGRLEGGGPVNIVADLAIARFNVRVVDDDRRAEVERRLGELVVEAGRRPGISARLHGEFRAPPRPVSPPMGQLLAAIATCGRDLGLHVDWQATGGVCDGNRLSAAGLPTVDTLGPRGGGLHSDEEFLVLDSLVERARLSALLLMRLADGSIRVDR